MSRVAAAVLVLGLVAAIGTLFTGAAFAQTGVNPTSTPVPPTSTPVPPTSTPVPPTSTPVPPTSTPAPPTSTPVPPTIQPTATTGGPTNTPGVPPTSTPAPPAPTATSSLPTDTPGPTFTSVPTAAATATLIPANQPTVTSSAATPPPDVSPVNTATGGQFVAIPTAPPGVDAVAIVTPAPSRPQDPTLILPAPSAGESPQVARVENLPLSSVDLPPGITAGRAIDLSFFDQAGNIQRTHDRPIELVFNLTDADLAAAGNDPSKIAVFRIDPVTGTAEPLPGTVDLVHRTIRVQTFKTSAFVLGGSQQTSQVVYRAYATNVVKNGRLVGGSSLANNAVSSLTLKNDANAIASVAALFYKDDGTKAIAGSTTYSVAAKQSLFIYVPNITTLPDGNYTAVFESNQDVKLIANTGSNFQATGPYGSASTPGTLTSQTGLQLFVPGVYKNYFGFSSLVRVQARSLTVTTRVQLNVVSTAGSTIATLTRDVAGGGSTTFDLSQFPNVPDGFIGSAVINGDRDIAANYFVTDATGVLSSGVAQLTGTSQAYIPSVYSNYFGYDSSIVIQNAGTGPVVVDVTYSNGMKGSFSIPTGNTQVLFTPNQGLQPGFFGSAVIRSSNGGTFVANVNVRNQSRGNLDTYDAVTSGTGSINIPSLYKNYASQQFVSSITLQNLGTVASDITITYDNGAVQPFKNVPAGGAVLSYQPNINELPDGYNLGAQITSANGVPIAAIVNIDANSGQLPPGDYLFAYRGFSS